MKITGRKNLSRKVFPLEVKADGVDFEASTFEGISAGIGNRDSGDDMIMPGAFSKTIRERIPTRKVKLLDSHSRWKTGDLFGTVIDAVEQMVDPDDRVEDGPSHVLHSVFEVSKADAKAQEALGKIAERHLNGLSIGYVPIKMTFELDDPDGQEDPRMAWFWGNALRKIIELAWWETSLVIWGMNEAALADPDSVKAMLDFAAQATLEGAEVTEDQIKEAVMALHGLLPEAAAKELFLETDVLKQLVETMGGALDAVEGMAVGDTAMDALTLAYDRFAVDSNGEGSQFFTSCVGKIAHPETTTVKLLSADGTVLSEFEVAPAEGADDTKVDGGGDAGTPTTIKTEGGDDDGTKVEPSTDIEGESLNEIRDALIGLRDTVKAIADATGVELPEPEVGTQPIKTAEAEGEGSKTKAEGEQVASDADDGTGNEDPDAKDGRTDERLADDDEIADAMATLEVMSLENRIGEAQP